jgi:hypothetical protein
MLKRYYTGQPRRHVKRDVAMTVDDDVAAMQTWEHSRTVVRVWLYVSVLLTAIGLFYAPAMVYTYTYDNGNPTAGTLVNERWSFPFVVQALYPLLLLVLFLSAAEMLVNWHHENARAYFYFHTIWSFICIVWLLGSGIALGIEAGAANTADAPTNFFNDYRYCGVFWSYAGPAAVCKLTAGYTPPVIISDLTINAEGIWMLVFHWIYFLYCCFDLGNMLTYYRFAQPPANILGDDEDDEDEQEEEPAAPAPPGRRTVPGVLTLRVPNRAKGAQDDTSEREAYNTPPSAAGSDPDANAPNGRTGKVDAQHVLARLRVGASIGKHSRLKTDKSAIGAPIW